MMQEGNGDTVFGPRDTNDMPFFSLVFDDPVEDPLDIIDIKIHILFNYL